MYVCVCVCVCVYVYMGSWQIGSKKCIFVKKYMYTYIYVVWSLIFEKI